MWITSSLEAVRTPTVVALGNFDGIHQGHRHVIDPVLARADYDASNCVTRFEAQVQSLDGSIPGQLIEGLQDTIHLFQSVPSDLAVTTLVSFSPHPQEFFTGQSRPLLTPLDEKIEYLDEIGMEQFVLLPFTQWLASMTPDEFVETILVEYLNAQLVSVGQNFRFGYQRSGTVDDLKAIATRFGLNVHIAPLYLNNSKRVSSSVIRQALAEGDLQQANCLLGRPYKLVGTVVHGQHLGRTIGFPTANLALPSDKLLPRHGVYYVLVDDLTNPQGAYAHPAVMNIGYRPTVGGLQITVEVHLLDWSTSLYGHTLAVRLNAFLRPEEKFASLNDLKAQINADCDAARVLSKS